MNYQNHYDVLIERARNRVLEGYVEVHHVLPRCMGGDDDRLNLVQLTAEEHFVAHQLLCKIHPSVRGLAFAVQAMTSFNSLQTTRTTNKLFGWLRQRYAKAQKGRVKSPEERANISAARRLVPTRTFSEEARVNMAEARRKTWAERKETGEHLVIGQKTRETRLMNGSYEFSEEHRKNIGLSSIGRQTCLGKLSPRKGTKCSEETKERMRIAQLNRPKRPKKEVVKMTPEEVSAIRKAASLKLWEERRGKGLGGDIGKKASETRRANGNYGVSPEVREKISKSLIGNNNRVKNL